METQAYFLEIGKKKWKTYNTFQTKANPAQKKFLRFPHFPRS